MSQNHSQRVALLQLHQTSLGKHLVDHAAALPEPHFPACFYHQIASKILVRREKDWLLGWNLADNFLRIARCADDVAQRFDLRAAIDVADHKMIGIALAKPPERIRRA